MWRLLELTFLSVCFSWQLVQELCDSKQYDLSILPLGWCSDTTTRCKWPGISCDQNGQLYALELYDVPLNIPLPETIDAPGPAVHTLKLVNCGLTGTVPGTLERVTTLKVLDLSNNRLEGEWPWTMVSVMEEFSIANNRLWGKTYFNSLTFPNQWQNMTRLNIANNSFTEEWDQVVEGYWPAMRHFNIENNQFSGAVPPIRTAYQYRIGGNYFGYFTPTFLQKAPSYHPLTLSDCDVSRVPFREVPPDWMKAYVDRCRYRYDPSNKLYMISDFTFSPKPTTTYTSVNTTTNTTRARANTDSLTSASSSAKEPPSAVSDLYATSFAARAIFSVALFCFGALLY